MQPNPQQMTNAEIRSELARRVRSARMASVANNPTRSFRAAMNACRKDKSMYHRLTGFPWAAKEVA